MKKIGKIDIYCRCERCGGYFCVTGRKASRYCGRSCREKVYYANRKALLKGKSPIEVI
jgi:hypothetical protein